MVAVADASAAGMTPDFSSDEEKPESGCGQRRMLQRVHVGLGLAVKEHEPGVQAIGQHGQLKMIPVHVKAARGMGCQSGVIVGFFDQVLGSGPLVVEPRPSE